MTSGKIDTVYLLGIGGIAMGTLASMLKEKGYQVAGSDQNLYPPMSTHLDRSGIAVFQGYDPENLKRCNPDLVVVGNVIRRDNPEARVLLENGIPYCSMPQAVGRFFLPHHRSLVVTGTHGKTTTSSLLAWVLTHAGLDPSAFVGGFLKDWNASHRLGQGPHMVIEGDEYDTAFFDKGPKFLHYRPHIGIVTGIEYDHADIFPSLAAIRRAFVEFARIIPTEGFLLVNGDDPNCIEVMNHCRGRVFTFGTGPGTDWRILDLAQEPGTVRIRFINPLNGGSGRLVSTLPGRHNAANVLAAMAAASLVGVTQDQFQEGLSSFSGVRRRQDVLGEVAGVLVMDDFAHHPTAVRETLAALRRHYPQRRIIAAFEPRTNSSRRSVFQNAYSTAFESADCVCIKDPPGMAGIPEGERLDPARLVSDIRKQGGDAHLFRTIEDLLRFLKGHCAAGDLVVCMSNGAFEDLPRRLIQALQ